MRPIDADELLTAFPIDDEPTITKSSFRSTVQNMPTLNLDDFLDISETEKYRLTPWGCLSVILDDYGVDYSCVRPAIGKHLVEDFLNLMEKSGYLKHISE